MMLTASPSVLACWMAERRVTVPAVGLRMSARLLTLMTAGTARSSRASRARRARRGWLVWRVRNLLNMLRTPVKRKRMAKSGRTVLAKGEAVAAAVVAQPARVVPYQEQAAATGLLEILTGGWIGNTVRIETGPFVLDLGQ